MEKENFEFDNVDELEKSFEEIYPILENYYNINFSNYSNYTNYINDLISAIRAVGINGNIEINPDESIKCVLIKTTTQERTIYGLNSGKKSFAVSKNIGSNIDFLIEKLRSIYGLNKTLLISEKKDENEIVGKFFDLFYDFINKLNEYLKGHKEHIYISTISTEQLNKISDFLVETTSTQELTNIQETGKNQNNANLDDALQRDNNVTDADKKVAPLERKAEDEAQKNLNTPISANEKENLPQIEKPKTSATEQFKADDKPVDEQKKAHGKQPTDVRAPEREQDKQAMADADNKAISPAPKGGEIQKANSSAETVQAVTGSSEKAAPKPNSNNSAANNAIKHYYDELLRKAKQRFSEDEEMFLQLLYGISTEEISKSDLKDDQINLLKKHCYLKTYDWKDPATFQIFEFIFDNVITYQENAKFSHKFTIKNFSVQQNKPSATDIIIAENVYRIKDSTIIINTDVDIYIPNELEGKSDYLKNIYKFSINFYNSKEKDYKEQLKDFVKNNSDKVNELEQILMGQWNVSGSIKDSYPDFKTALDHAGFRFSDDKDRILNDTEYIENKDTGDKNKHDKIEVIRKCILFDGDIIQAAKIIKYIYTANIITELKEYLSKFPTNFTMQFENNYEYEILNLAIEINDSKMKDEEIEDKINDFKDKVENKLNQESYIDILIKKVKSTIDKSGSYKFSGEGDVTLKTKLGIICKSWESLIDYLKNLHDINNETFQDYLKRYQDSPDKIEKLKNCIIWGKDEEINVLKLTSDYPKYRINVPGKAKYDKKTDEYSPPKKHDDRAKGNKIIQAVPDDFIEGLKQIEDFFENLHKKTTSNPLDLEKNTQTIVDWIKTKRNQIECIYDRLKNKNKLSSKEIEKWAEEEHKKVNLVGFLNEDPEEIFNSYTNKIKDYFPDIEIKAEKFKDYFITEWGKLVIFLAEARIERVKINKGDREKIGWKTFPYSGAQSPNDKYDTVANVLSYGVQVNEKILVPPRVEIFKKR